MLVDATERQLCTDIRSGYLVISSVARRNCVGFEMDFMF
jgi:hypothetical protein